MGITMSLFYFITGIIVESWSLICFPANPFSKSKEKKISAYQTVYHKISENWDTITFLIVPKIGQFGFKIQ